jgi:BirA family biotin operon repressor/biotin-[acetyl-CoA-carboxylase] ligase
VSAALAERSGVRVVEHGRIDSTMAAALLDEGPPPAVHRAESQTAGRGRHGRIWESPPGNLYATIRWPDGDPPLAPTLLAAIQVEWARAIRAAGGPDVRCKWPNDGWLHGEKWAGLLAVRPARRPGELHVGLGVNLIAAPRGMEPAATDLRSHWPAWPGAETVAALLIDAVLAVLADGSGGLAARLADWPRYDALAPGTPLIVEEAGALATRGPRTGAYLGIDPEGRLRLLVEKGETRIASGRARRVRPL